MSHSREIGVKVLCTIFQVPAPAGLSQLMGRNRTQDECSQGKDQEACKRNVLKKDKDQEGQEKRSVQSYPQS